MPCYVLLEQPLALDCLLVRFLKMGLSKFGKLRSRGRGHMLSHEDISNLRPVCLQFGVILAIALSVLRCNNSDPCIVR